MYIAEMEPEEWARIRDREIWLRLARIARTDATLDPAADGRLADLSNELLMGTRRRRERRVSPLEDLDGKWRTFVATPRRRRDLSQWLREHPEPDHWKEVTGSNGAEIPFPPRPARYANWPVPGAGQPRAGAKRSRHGPKDALIQRSWRCMAPLLTDAPDDILKELIHGVSWWLRSVAETFEGHVGRFFALCDRMLS